MKPLEYRVTQENDGATIKHILQCVFKMSESHISRLKKRENGILQNGSRVYVTARASVGDVIFAEIEDDSGTVKLAPMDIPLKIAYEDEWLAAIDKPAGMTVHPERKGAGGSVENALSAHFGAGEFCHTVNRLDRGTSGLLIAAKCGYMHERMQKLLHTGEFLRQYRAIATGRIESRTGEIELPLSHVEGSHYMMKVDAAGAYSLTKYEVEAYLSIENEGVKTELTLVRLLPQTGRMHQLRVHMAAISHPLLGDWLYGEESKLIDHAALHSCSIYFRHPITGEAVFIEAPFHSDIQTILNSCTSAE